MAFGLLLRMSNLKQDLDEYLLLQSDQKKNFNVKLPQIKVPGLAQIFSRTSEPPEANSWLKDTQDSCCPKLVGDASDRIIQLLLLCL